MNTEELTQVVTAHQSAISRQEQWQAEHETRLERIEAILAATAAQQQLNTQTIAQNQQAIANLIAAQELTRQDIAQLTAGIADLRNQVADWMSNRNQNE